MIASRRRSRGMGMRHGSRVILMLPSLSLLCEVQLKIRPGVLYNFLLITLVFRHVLCFCSLLVQYCITVIDPVVENLRLICLKPEMGVSRTDHTLITLQRRLYADLTRCIPTNF